MTGKHHKDSKVRAQDVRPHGHHHSPANQHGLAATLNYHQQLRKELGMPQAHPSPTSTPTHALSTPPYSYPYSNIITPLPSSSDSSLHASADSSPVTPTSTYAQDYKISLGYEANLKKYHDAFQSLHGHCSTPHLPSATLTLFEQPLSGSDPNLRSDLKQNVNFPYYDNISSARSRANQPGDITYVNETLAFVDPHGPPKLPSRPSKSSSSLPTSS
ncbi:unnamed protein product, partial [Lymnaea stagnalis]